MAPMAKITFKAILDWFMEINAKRWHLYVQASQFETGLYGTYVQPETGMLIINVSPTATRDFETDEETFSFSSRIKGEEVYLTIPYTAVFMAVDPTTGIPNSFPYFEDYGDDYHPDTVSDDTKSELINFATPSLDNDVLAKSRFGSFHLGAVMDSPIITKESDGVIRLEFPATPTKDPFFNPGKDLKVRTADLYKFPDQSLLGHDSLEDKMRQRKWTVIQGGKGSETKSSMPYIDEVYRAKRKLREQLHLEKDVLIIGNTMKSSKPEIRSDGSNGESKHFPDLDVSKCQFTNRKVKRPDWLTVIDGDQ